VNIEKMGNCSEPSKISKTGINACIFKTVFEILFGGYATPTKCVAFRRLALNSLEVGSEQLRKWNINKKKKMTNSTKYIDC